MAIDWDNPVYATHDEPSELKRLQCDECQEGEAFCHCPLCDKRYCDGCENNVHSAMVVIKAEPGTSVVDNEARNGSVHRTQLVQCQPCQQCNERRSELYCMECKQSLCEKCCLGLEHRTHSGHAWVCMQGAPQRLHQYEVWHPDVINRAKTARRNRQQSLDQDELTPSQAPTIPAPLTTDSTSAVRIKMERVRMDDVVDLTADEEVEHELVASEGLVERIKQECIGMLEQPTTSTLPVNSSSQENPVVAMLTAQYQERCEAITRAQQQVDDSAAKVRVMVSRPFLTGQEVDQVRDRLAAAQKALSDELLLRDAIVARIILFMHSDNPAQLQSLLQVSNVVDIPAAQAASHRKCASIEASIRDKQEQLKALKQHIDDALTIKSSNDAFQEVTRLGSEIASQEQAIRALERERLDEFVTLCRFSLQIRQAALRMR